MWRAYTLSIVYFEEMEKFITNVRKRPALWNPRLPDNYNRPLIRQLWSEVEDECNMEAGSAAKKFKSLKDTFRREYRKVPEKSKWIYFKHMLFLKDIIGPTTQPPVLCTTLNTNNESSTETYDIEEVLINESSKQAETLFQIEPYREQPNFNNKRRIREMLLPSSNSENKRSKITKSSETSYEQKNINTISRINHNATADIDDDDYHFLMSCRKYLKAMPAKKKLLFRIKMQELLYKYVYSDESQTHPSISNCSSTNMPFRVTIQRNANENENNALTETEFDVFEEYEDIKPDITLL